MLHGLVEFPFSLEGLHSEEVRERKKKRKSGKARKNFFFEQVKQERWSPHFAPKANPKTTQLLKEVLYFELKSST